MIIISTSVIMAVLSDQLVYIHTHSLNGEIVGHYVVSEPFTMKVK